MLSHLPRKARAARTNRQHGAHGIENARGDESRRTEKSRSLCAGRKKRGHRADTLAVNYTRQNEAEADASQKDFDVKRLSVVRKRVDEIGTSDDGNAANGQTKNRVEWAPGAVENDIGRVAASGTRKLV